MSVGEVFIWIGGTWWAWLGLYCWYTDKSNDDKAAIDAIATLVVTLPTALIAFGCRLLWI